MLLNVRYDPMNKVQHVTDEMNLGYSFHYSGQTTTVTNNRGHHTTFHHNPDGVATRIRNAAGRETTIKLDGSNRVAQYFMNQKLAATYHYNDSGLITKINVPGQGNYSFSYDADGLINGAEWPPGEKYRVHRNSYGDITAITAGKEARCEFERDGDGNITTYWHREGVHWAFDYDQNGRFIFAGDHKSAWLDLTYDKSGMVSQVMAADGSVWQGQHDSLGCLASATSGKNLAMHYELNQEGSVKRKDFNVHGTHYTLEWQQAGEWRILLQNDVPVLRVKLDENGNVIAYEENGRETRIMYNEVDEPTCLRGDTTALAELMAGAGEKGAIRYPNHMNEKWAPVDEDEIASSLWKLSADNYGHLMWEGLCFDSKSNVFRIIWPLIPENDWAEAVYERGFFQSVAKMNKESNQVMFAPGVLSRVFAYRAPEFKNAAKSDELACWTCWVDPWDGEVYDCQYYIICQVIGLIPPPEPFHPKDEPPGGGGGEPVVEIVCRSGIVQPDHQYHAWSPNGVTLDFTEVGEGSSGSIVTWSVSPSATITNGTSSQCSITFNDPALYTVSAQRTCPDINQTITSSIQIAVVKVENVIAQGATRVTKVLGDQHMLHFVTPKGGSGDRVTLTATIVPYTVDLDFLITWEGATKISATQATVPKDQPAEHSIQIKLGSSVLKRLKVWSVWANNISMNPHPGSNSNGIEIGYGNVVNNDSTSDSGLYIYGGYTFKYEIEPISILSTSAGSNIPNLTGINQTSPPGGFHWSGLPLSQGVSSGPNKKWDVSRQIKVKLLNPANYPSSQLSTPQSFWTAIPNLNIYPEDPVEGNDDAVPEANDPYAIATLGVLNSYDRPFLGIQNATGSDGDTFEIRHHFREFVRLEIENDWYLISDYQLWRVHMRWIRNAGSWSDNNSFQEANNQDF